jgi:hypothetical protein
MSYRSVYEIVQNGSGWVLRRQGSIPLVEFPTRSQAVRAGVAVSLDEGLASLLVRRVDGSVEELDPTLLSLDV